MPTPWYERYFTADYWTYATAEYSAQRTAAEVDYLAAVLTDHAPGRRVVDLGCGVGRHAIGLARRGFDVVGLDVSAWALRRAGEAARQAGVALDLRRVDLLGSDDWAVGRVSAVICVQAFGWGSDADQLRMLRRIRGVLEPGGVLVLDHSNASAILRMYQAEHRVEVDRTWFHFLRRYDAATGRSGGELRVSRPDGSTSVLPDDVRLYQPPEIRALLYRAGFEVSRVDAEFAPGRRVGMDSRYVQFVARVPDRPRPALAGHRFAPPAGTVDLRWAPDEVEFVADAIDAAWHAVAGTGGLLDRSRRYDLTDPHAGERAAPVLAEHFGVRLDAAQVTAGAGATGLLRGLAGLAAGGTVLVTPFGHPELAEAAAELTATVRVATLDPSAAAAGAVRACRPAVTVLDRPGVRGRVCTVPDVRELARVTAERGGILVVDETCASYLPAGDSAVPLVNEVGGLVVIRSLSKGYCCGGLRLGFAVASADVAAAVRAVSVPLAASALSFDVGCALLARADALEPLRRRIAEVKPEFVAALERIGLHPQPGHPLLPWVTLPADEPVQRALAGRGLVGKEVRPAGPGPALLRLSVPLSAGRRRAAVVALTASEGHVDAAG